MHAITISCERRVLAGMCQTASCGLLWSCGSEETALAFEACLSQSACIVSTCQTLATVQIIWAPTSMNLCSPSPFRPVKKRGGGVWSFDSSFHGDMRNFHNQTNFRGPCRRAAPRARHTGRKLGGTIPSSPRTPRRADSARQASRPSQQD